MIQTLTAVQTHLRQQDPIGKHIAESTSFMGNLKQCTAYAERFKYQAEKYMGYSFVYKGIKADQVRGKLKAISENVQMLQVQMTAFYLQPINQ